jgi:hypothetical protein
MGVLLQSTTPTSVPENEMVLPLKVASCDEPQWLDATTHESAAEQAIVMGSGVAKQSHPVHVSSWRDNV